MQELSFDSRHELVPRVRDQDVQPSSDENQLMRVRHLPSSSSSVPDPLCLSLRGLRFNGWNPNQVDNDDYDDDEEQQLDYQSAASPQDISISASVAQGGVDAELTNLASLHESMGRAETRINDDCVSCSSNILYILKFKYIPYITCGRVYNYITSYTIT